LSTQKGEKSVPWTIINSACVWREVVGLHIWVEMAVSQDWLLSRHHHY